LPQTKNVLYQIVTFPSRSLGTSKNEQKRAKSWSLGTSKFIIILKLKKLELISSGVADFALA
jgi:hypothetical protein